MECSREQATFELNVEQYVGCFTYANDGSRIKPTTTFFCSIPDSGKYKNWSSKPNPGNKRYTSVSGVLTGVDRLDNDSGVGQFKIEVDNVTFCGPYIPPATNSAASANQQSRMCSGLNLTPVIDF
jgi:hypothetical protein